MRITAYAAAGVVSAVLGLLPWLITGMRLPLQDLSGGALPGEGPFALLPFSQYALTLVFAIIVVGSTVGGLVARATRGRRPRFALTALVAGVLLVQLAALAQTTIVVTGVVKSTSKSSAFLGVLIGGAVFALVVGMLVLLLFAKARAAGAVVATAVAAVALATWLAGLVVPFGVPTRDPNLTVLTATRWVPAIVAGLAVAWWGVSTLGRVVAAVGALFIVWLGPALLTAISAAGGSDVLVERPGEMVVYGGRVFERALGDPGGALGLAVFCAALMMLGLAVRWLLQGTRWAIPDSNG